MRPIDADALMRDIEKYHLSDGKFQHWVEVQPTIEPERKTGKWEYTNHYRERYRVCPFCGSERKDDHSTGWRFCPSCGAKLE